MPTNPTTRLNRFSKSWTGPTLYSVPIQIRLATADDIPAIGFAPDGVTNILTGLGGVEELRYVRDL
jgi:hypothetical protein